MGRCINPGNNGFAEIVRAGYVDKTSLAGLINRTIGTRKKLTCLSLPGGFGKTYAAEMLCAYYDRTCDSGNLFSDYAAAAQEGYSEHLNRYHVIRIDVSGFVSEAAVKGIPVSEVPAEIERAVLTEVQERYPETRPADHLTGGLLRLVRSTGRQIVFVMDDWDAMIRKAASDPAAQNRYTALLRLLFKNMNFTPEAVAAAFLTGAFPIGYGVSQSAMADFREFTMLEPGPFAEYAGFTEREVREACGRSGRSFEEMKRWYGGYTVGNGGSMYNPYSVMQALRTGTCRSYREKLSTVEKVMACIDVDRSGLREDAAALLAGESVPVRTDAFPGITEAFGRNECLTLLMHLGCLTCEEVPDACDPEHGKSACFARIPNEEGRTGLADLLRRNTFGNLA